MSKSAGRPGSAGRAIITFARGWQTLVATRSLGRRGVEVVTGDEYAMTASSFSKYSVAEFRYPNPDKEPEKFLDVLEKVVLEHKPEDPSVPYVLMPIHKETYLISRHRERFEPHIRVPLPDIDVIERVHNKGTLASYAIERGLPMPKTWIPKSPLEFDEMASEIELPAFVKLRGSAAGVGVQKVDTLDHLKSTYHEFIDHFKLGEGVAIVGVGDGGVAEAIEVEPDGSASWIVGIQWHPELEFTDDDQNRLFAEFIDQARGARTPATPGRKE